MNIEEKYRIKYLISLFKQLLSQVDNYNLDDFEEDADLVDDVHQVLLKTYGYDDINERDYLFDAFIKNYHATGGDFDKLGVSVKPMTPQLKSYEIEENEWCEVRITNSYTLKTYNEAIVKSLLYNGYLDPDDYEQDIIECSEREVDIKEVPPKEENDSGINPRVNEDLEYWETDTEGPEDDKYGMGPSE